MIYNNFLINQKKWDFLKSLKTKSKIPNALLFHGKDGVGKEAYAIEFASLITCHSNLNDFACGECIHCNKIINNNHENISYIFALALQLYISMFI